MCRCYKKEFVLYSIDVLSCVAEKMVHREKEENLQREQSLKVCQEDTTVANPTGHNCCKSDIKRFILHNMVVV